MDVEFTLTSLKSCEKSRPTLRRWKHLEHRHWQTIAHSMELYLPRFESSSKCRKMTRDHTFFLFFFFFFSTAQSLVINWTLRLESRPTLKRKRAEWLNDISKLGPLYKLPHRRDRGFTWPELKIKNQVLTRTNTQKKMKSTYWLKQPHLVRWCIARGL